jgi:hypothetical protein
MARVDLRCVSCGYMFFVADQQLSRPDGVKCPSCLAPVALDGPVAGPAKRPPGQPLTSAGGDSRMKLYVMIGGGVALILVIVLFMALTGSSKPPEVDPAFQEPPVTSAPKTTSKPIVKEAPKAPPKSTASAPKLPAAPTPPPKVPTAPKPVEPSAPAEPASGPLPEDVVQALRGEMLTLKDYHLGLALSTPEKARMDALLAAGKGTAGDVDFLKSLVSSPRLRVVREEATMILEALARLDKDALEGLPVDKVLMNDGRVLHGKVVEEGKDVVKLERKFAGGVQGVMPLARPGIKDLQKGKGLGSEFKTKWDEAKAGGTAKMLGLLAWCKESTLPLQASLVAYTILSENPGVPEARQEAGFATDPVSRMLEAEKQGGFITHEGRRWVPSELRDKLLRDGYKIVDGRWMSRKEKLIGVPGLFRYESQADKPVTITGNLAAEEVVSYQMVQDLTTNSFTEKTEVKIQRKFYAATPLTVTPVRTNGPSSEDAETVIVTDRPNPAANPVATSEVHIAVPLGAPLLDASVMMTAEVKSGAMIAVSLLQDGSKIPLFNCQAKEDRTHKLPEAAARGKSELTFVADITAKAVYKAKAEKKRVRGSKKDGGRILQRGLDVHYNLLIPEYQAMLFPSNSNTIEVFRLTAGLAEPAPGLDKLFENAKDVLTK